MGSTLVSARRDVIVIGATSSDAHVVSIYLISMMLEESGYEVINLSCCNETHEFFDAIPSDRMTAAVVIVNQNGCALADLSDLPVFLKDRSIPVILGGHYQVGCVAKDEIDLKLYKLGVSCIAETPEAMFGFLSGLDRNGMRSSSVKVSAPS